MHNSYLAVGAAALAAWIFGAVYYGVLGKTWLQAQGVDPETRKGQKMPLTPMVVSLACEAIMALFFANVLGVMRASGQQPGLEHSAIVGLLLGIGFMVTTTLVNNMFQQRKLMLTAIDGVHWVGVAVIECVVLALLL